MKDYGSRLWVQVFHRPGHTAFWDFLPKTKTSDTSFQNLHFIHKRDPTSSAGSYPMGPSTQAKGFEAHDSIVCAVFGI